MTQPNRVALALSSIFAGGGAGAAVATVLVWLSWTGWPFLSVFGDPRNLVFAGNFVIGPLIGFIVSWRLLRGIGETWRHTALAFTAAVAAFIGSWCAFPVSMFAMMVSSPLLSALLVPAYFVAMLVIFIFSARIARRHRMATPAL
jgi:hypothetical protein